MKKNFIMALLNRKAKNNGLELENLTIQEAAELLGMDWRRLEDILTKED